MADEILKRDQDRATVGGAVTNDSNLEIRMLRVDNTTKGLLTEIVDAAGNQITSFGSPILPTDYKSPDDFTVTYTSASTVTLTGLPFTIATGMQISYIKIRNSSTNLSYCYVHGAGGYAFGHSAGVVTAYKDGVAASIFTANDMYEMGINYQLKAYDKTTDTTKTVNQSPDRASYVQDSLLDTTNVTAATNYYPSTLGMSMDGFKDLSLTGKFIDADNTTTMTVEATNDEDATNADWVQVYGFDTKGNAMTNSVVAASTTTTFAWDFDNLNYSLFRVKVVNGDNTNTMIIKARRKSL